MKTLVFNMAKMIFLIIFVCPQLVSGQKISSNQGNQMYPHKTKQNPNAAVCIRYSDTVNPVKAIMDYSLIRNDYFCFFKFSDTNKIGLSDFFAAFAGELGIKEYDSYVLQGYQPDNLGFKHFNYVQHYKDVPVMGGQFLLHEKDGILKSANGNFYNDLDIDVTPSLSRKHAREKAMEYINNTGTGVVDTSVYSELKLIIAPLYSIYKTENFRLCWKQTIATSEPYGKWDVYIDAHSGDFVSLIPLVYSEDGTAYTLYSGTQTIETKYYNSKYILKDEVRNIETYDIHNQENLGLGTIFSDNDNIWVEQNFMLTQVDIIDISNSWWYSKVQDELPDLYIKIRDGSSNVVYSSDPILNTNPPVTINTQLSLNNTEYTLELWDHDFLWFQSDFGGSYDVVRTSGTSNFSGGGNSGTYTIEIPQNNPALDVHWAIGKTYDYFLDRFSRDGYDTLHGLIKNYVHYGIKCNNAYSDASGLLFGDGNGTSRKPYVSLDICGHEFTHRVVANNGNGGLDYHRESGALNESFCDIFGTAIEQWVKPTSGNWLLAEDIYVSPGSFMRSLADPALKSHPDTYEGGPFWRNTDCREPNKSNDYCGVHTNSGVMNYWFYLLTLGGSNADHGDAGNDLNNPYTVDGIGISKAEQITYRTLVYYLTSNATFYDAMQGSLQAAADLYGANSQEWCSVKNAWYAVGVGTRCVSIGNYCYEKIIIKQFSGVFDDGNSLGNYNNNASCGWLIIPPGADFITLNFNLFDLELNFDSVVVYDGPSESYNVLLSWTGNTLPPQVSSTSGAVLVKLYSDNSNNAGGFEASWQTTGNDYCEGETILSDASGSFSDGSGAYDYGNNYNCSWLIAPPGAATVTLSFSSFNIEQDYDSVLVYDDFDDNANLLAVYTGNILPDSVTSPTGKMMVRFVSDFSMTYSGWEADYSSSGSSACTDANVLTSDAGSFDDGSSSNDYYNNSDCGWLIQPPDASSIYLFFNEFELEEDGEDGNVHDVVEVYDGADTTSQLLGTFSGSMLPEYLVSSGGSMYVRFKTDFSGTAPGWSAYYYSTTPGHCDSITTLTASSGSFSDGSGTSYYGNYSDCQWLIQPPWATSITLSFSSFDTELNFDGCVVYDGSDTSAAQLGFFTGSSLPADVTSTGGSMLVWFLSDETVRGNGWEASYNSVLSIEEQETNDVFTVYPNPNNGSFNIISTLDDCYAEIMNIKSNKCYFNQKIIKGVNNIDVHGLSEGIYVLKITGEESVYYKKLVIE